MSSNKGGLYGNTGPYYPTTGDNGRQTLHPWNAGHSRHDCGPDRRGSYHRGGSWQTTHIWSVKTYYRLYAMRHGGQKSARSPLRRHETSCRYESFSTMDHDHCLCENVILRTFSITLCHDTRTSRAGISPTFITIPSCMDGHLPSRRCSTISKCHLRVNTK
jgi:hypothetical protein